MNKMNWEPIVVDDLEVSIADTIDNGKMSEGALALARHVMKSGTPPSPFKRGVVTPVLFERTLPEIRWNPERYALHPPHLR